MRHMPLLAVACLTLTVGASLHSTGCQRGSDPTVPVPQSPGATALPEAVTPLAAATRLPLYEIAFDPLSLDATVTYLPSRTSQAQPPQALTYDLDIEQFLNGDSFDLTEIRLDAEGDYIFGFEHAHPFPAPDFTRPPTGTNRADLGYTGRLLILANRTTQRHFGNTIALDPTLVKAPAGYVHPGDLLAGTGLANNTFPYVLLADDGQDNRVEVSNGGIPSGNFNQTMTGWQRVNAGSNNTGWTGFDFIHGGQKIRNSFSLNRAALGSGQVSFAVAFLIKYTDPRGVGGASARLPGATIDPFNFAYRLPFAALDLSTARLTTTDFLLDIKQNDTLRLDLEVRDWDAFANEAADLNLSDEADARLIPAGTAGLPLVEIDAPFLSAVPQVLDQFDGGVGEPTVELRLGGQIANLLGTATVGDYPALIRLTDPEDALDDGYHFGVDPLTIAASPARALKLTTYVPFTITLEDILSCPPTEISFDFNSNGHQEWLAGGLGVPNADFDGWGGWSIGCTVPAAQTAFPGLSGKYWSSTNDDPGSQTTCPFPEDYGSNADYNLISPRFALPALCGPMSAVLVINGGMWTRTGAQLRFYTSVNEGTDWQLQHTIEATDASMAFSNLEVPLTGLTGDQDLRVRVQFTDPTTFPYAPETQPYVGVFLDNLTLRATTLGTITVKSEAPCIIWKEDFEGATAGWTEYGLPQTDAAIAEGGACGFPGPWGGPAVCSVSAGNATGNAMTFGGDAGDCFAFPADLAHSSDFNIVSPPINLTTATTGTELRLDDITGAVAGFQGWTTTIYAAINPASGPAGVWGAPLLTNVHAPGEPVGSEALSVEIPPGLLGQNNVRLRIQITTAPNTTGYSECPGAENICDCGPAYTFSNAGDFGVDNLRIGLFAPCD